MSGYHKRDFENFPMHKIKRVDRPTTIIHDNEVKRSMSATAVSTRQPPAFTVQSLPGRGPGS